MDIGFVGLGDQGLPIAARLAADARWRVHVWARRPEAAAPVVAAGADVAESLPALARSCDVVGVCVTDDTAVVSVVGDLVRGMRAGGVVLVHSTVLPATCVELARAGSARGVFVLDAPVSGGSDAARDGRLTVLIGGAESVVDQVRPVLGSFAASVVRQGDVGAAQAVKIVNNVLLMANAGAALDGLDVVRGSGGDRDAAIAALATSSGGSYALGRLGKLTSPGFVDHAVALLSKDLRLYGDLAGPAGDELASSARRFLDRLVALSPSAAGARPPR